MDPGSCAREGRGGAGRTSSGDRPRPDSCAPFYTPGHFGSAGTARPGLTPVGPRLGGLLFEKRGDKGGRPHLSGWILCFYPCRKGIQEALERVRSSSDLQTGRIVFGGLETSPYLFLSSLHCNARATYPPQKQNLPALGWEVWGEAPSLRLGFRGSTPVVEGSQVGSKRLRSLRSRLGRIKLVGRSLPCFSSASVFCNSHAQLLGSPRPLPRDGDRRSPRTSPRPLLHAFRTVCRICPVNRPKGNAPPGFRRGAPRGEAPCSGWILRIYPCKGASGKNMRWVEIEGISKDGRMTTGWSATSPSVHLLRCLYLMQSLYLKPFESGASRRISGLQGGPPASPPERAPAGPLLSCNCFLSLMAFLQFYRVCLRVPR